MNSALLTILLWASLSSTVDDSAAFEAVSPAELQQINDSLRADDVADQSLKIPGVPTGCTNAAPAVQSMNPDLSVILDAALAAFNTSQPLQLGGHDPKQPGFNLQQLELHIGAHVDPYFHFDGNIVFGKSEVEIEEAFATALSLPGNLQVRAGQFLTRFGRINAMHPHQWHFTNQPLVNGKFFGGDGNRVLGAEISWLSFLPWYLETIVSANEAYGGCCARSYLDDSLAATSGVEDLLWTTAIKQFFPLGEDLSILWGVSFQTGPNKEAGRSLLYGSDLYLRYRPLASSTRQSVSLQIETILRRRQTSRNTLQDAGGYAEIVWEIDANFEVGGRSEIVSGMDNDYLTYEDESWPDRRWRHAAQITYYPSHFSRLRLQGQVDRLSWQSRPIYGLLAAFEVSVGAHGAHSY